MRIAITSQNFRTISGHAGKTRRFLVYDAQPGEPITEISRLDLPKEMSIHEYSGDDHPVFSVDIIITGGCGEGFLRRMAAHDVRVITTSETDPVDAVVAVAQGQALPAAIPHTH